MHIQIILIGACIFTLVYYAVCLHVYIRPGAYNSQIALLLLCIAQMQTECVLILKNQVLFLPEICLNTRFIISVMSEFRYFQKKTTTEHSSKHSLTWSHALTLTKLQNLLLKTVSVFFLTSFGSIGLQLTCPSMKYQLALSAITKHFNSREDVILLAGSEH